MSSRAAAGAAEVNSALNRQSTISRGSRYQPGYSADGVIQVVEHVERIGKPHYVQCFSANATQLPQLRRSKRHKMGRGVWSHDIAFLMKAGRTSKGPNARIILCIQAVEQHFGQSGIIRFFSQINHFYCRLQSDCLPGFYWHALSLVYTIKPSLAIARAA